MSAIDSASDGKAAPGNDWLLANPWFWMLGGVSSAALAWALVLAEDFSGLRFFLVGQSLLFAGISLNLRLGSEVPHYLANGFQALILVTVGLFHGLLVIGVTALLLLSIVGIEAIYWKPGQLVLLWFVLAPMSATAATVCLGRSQRGESLTRGEEGSALLTLAGLTCFFAHWALFNPDSPQEADTLRTLLAAMVLAAFVAAPLLVVPQNVRRAVVSGLILLHFGGICTAALSAPPTPWVIGQLWGRIYRPYLEFMYLNNAYHFYSPEPGPASYLWFRLAYFDPKEPKTVYYHWVKIPDIDERGFPKYPVALEYQRVLALTENAVAGSPAVTFVNPTNQKPLPFYERRLKILPTGGVLVGIPKSDMEIPFHPYIFEHQYLEPNKSIKNLLQSYARHVARMKHPDNPHLVFQRVKIYKLTHLLPIPPVQYIRGMDVRFPENYRAFFLGEFDAEGKMWDKNDPMLYWLLPSFRDGKPLAVGLVKIHIPDAQDRARFADATKGEFPPLPKKKDMFLVPEGALKVLKTLHIDYEEKTRLFNFVVKSYLHKHARDDCWLYLAEEDVYVDGKGLPWKAP